MITQRTEIFNIINQIPDELLLDLKNVLNNFLAHKKQENTNLLTKEQLAYNEMIYKIGTGTKFDILRSKSEVESAQSDIENAIFNLKVAQTNLANLIGMPILSNLLPKDKFINKIELVDDSKSVEELFDSALIMRNDIIAKENSIKSLFAKRNANFSDIIPTVSVSWQGAIVGTFATGGRRNDTLGLSVTAPIGKNLGVNTWTKYKMDNINCKVAQLELDRLKTEIQQNIANNYYSIRAKSEIINSKNQQISSSDFYILNYTHLTVH